MDCTRRGSRVARWRRRPLSADFLSGLVVWIYQDAAVRIGRHSFYGHVFGRSTMGYTTRRRPPKYAFQGATGPRPTAPVVLPLPWPGPSLSDDWCKAVRYVEHRLGIFAGRARRYISASRLVARLTLPLQMARRSYRVSECQNRRGRGERFEFMQGSRITLLVFSFCQVAVRGPGALAPY